MLIWFHLEKGEVIMNDLKREDGYALVLTVVIVAVLMIFVGIMANLIDNELGFYNRNKSSSRAFYAAESGIAYGTHVYKDIYKSDWESGEYNIVKDEDNGIYSLSNTSVINDELENAKVNNLEWEFSGNNKITFNAIGDNITRSIESVYSIIPGIFDNVITVLGNIEIKNNQIINSGNVVSRGGYTANSGKFLDPDENEINIVNDDTLEIDIFDSVDWMTLADEVYEEDEVIDYENIGNQITYVNGSLEMGSNITINGSGILVIADQLIVKNQVDINQTDGNTDYFSIIVLGGNNPVENIVVEDPGDFEGKNQFNIQGLVYSEGDVSFKNKFDITGALITKGNLDLQNSNAKDINIQYDTGFINSLANLNITFPDSESSQYSISKLISWSEE
jgi:hypothetical protein